MITMRHRSVRLLAPASMIIIVVILVLSGCGSPAVKAGHPRSATPSIQLSEFAFSACMRAHGIQDFPDPDPGGRPLSADPQQLGVSTVRYQAAEHACDHLLPTGGSLQQQTQHCLVFGACPQTLVQRLLIIERRYARCMRNHGVPNFPDPSIGAKGGRPVFDLSSAGIDVQSTDSPQFAAKERACRNIPGGPVPNLPFT